MLITAMHNWRPDPGELLEWRATASARAAAVRAPEAGTPTFLQQNHLSAFTAGGRRGESHHAYLGASTELDGELHPELLSEALRHFVRRHEGLRSWFEPTGSGYVRRLLDSDAVDFEWTSAGHFRSDDEFALYARERFSTEAAATSWPGFSIGAVRRPEGFTLYFGCDHSFSDGVSQATAIAEIADLYQAATRNQALELAPTGSFIDYAAAEEQLTQHYPAHTPELDEWTSVFRAHGGAMPTFPLDLGLAPGERAPVVPIELDLLEAADTERFESVCRGAGGRILNGILAAIAITDLELADRTDYFGMTVLSSRAAGDFGASIGWFCTFAPISFSTAASLSFTDLVPVAHAAFERTKAMATVPIATALTALLRDGALDPSAGTNPNMLSYIDFRKLPAAGTTNYERAIQFTGEGRTANASMWFNRDDDHLYLGAQTPGTPFAQEQVHRYHAHLAAVIRAVATDGDYTIRSEYRSLAVAPDHH